MDRGAWQATVHRVTRVGRDLRTKPPPPYRVLRLASRMINCFLNQEGTGGEANTDGSKPHLLRDGLKGKERTEQLILLGKDFTEDQ